MRYLIITVGSLFALAGQASAAEQSLLARVTVYWKGESGSRASWNGARLHDGHCAVDPKRIPYGSKVVFPDATCLAVDTGTDVVSRKAARSTGRSAAQKEAIVIDRYFDSKADAMAWVSRNPHFMTVKVQPPESRKARAQRKLAEIPSPVMTPAELDGPASLLFATTDWTRKLWQWGLESCSLLPSCG